MEEVPLEQIIKQLNKLLHVLKIVDLDPETTVERELVLIKVAADESNRSDVLEIVRLFRVRVVDVNPESLTIEATGAEGKIDALLGLLEHYGIIELVRSGAVAVTRGPEAEREGARLRDHRSLNGLSGIAYGKAPPHDSFRGAALFISIHRNIVCSHCAALGMLRMEREHITSTALATRTARNTSTAPWNPKTGSKGASHSTTEHRKHLGRNRQCNSNTPLHARRRLGEDETEEHRVDQRERQANKRIGNQHDPVAVGQRHRQYA